MSDPEILRHNEGVEHPIQPTWKSGKQQHIHAHSVFCRDLVTHALSGFSPSAKKNIWGWIKTQYRKLRHQYLP